SAIRAKKCFLQQCVASYRKRQLAEALDSPHIDAYVSCLPRNLAHELNIARSPDTEVRIETAVIGAGSDKRGVRRTWGGFGEIRMIKRVEKAGTEFKTEPFADFECSLERDIPGVQTWSDERIARTVSKCTRSGLSKRTR